MKSIIAHVKKERRCLLGCVLVGPGVLAIVIEINHFHRNIYGIAMRSTFERGNLGI